ncbi:MAG: ATP-dependent RecD-like DNA helicase [Tetragenococcus koreensis]|nr:ATP-dependent RecD-like DNA helicase [Tetragenococcus koreensis]
MKGANCPLSEESYIFVKVAAIFLKNPNKFYKVLLVKISETNMDYNEKEIVVTGSFGNVQEEELYRFLGERVVHPKYGEQFKANSYQKEQPTSENGLIQFLSSEKFPGVGKKTAEKIVALLGEEAIDKILDDPTLLEQISGLTKKKREMLLDTIRLNYGMDKMIVGLNRYGFGSQLAFAIYQTYKNDTLEVIEENPYQLVEDIEGIGFKKADNIAEQLGIDATSNKRIRAAILHQILQQSMETGNTYIAAKDLLEQVLHMLENSRPVEIDPEKVANGVIELVEEGKIQQEKTDLYENSLYFAEWGIASTIQRLLQRKKEITYSENKIDKNLRKLEKRLGIVYGNSQEEAIKEAIRAPLFILTGGPGTGKTTVISGIVQLFAELNDIDLDPSQYSEETFPILLAAPTGRAAKRMNETTGLPSSTIHRLLGLNGRENKAKNTAPKELEGGLLIVDEMSMVDTWLANTLFKAIPDNMQVIFVGDKDQLPSVGPGQVLHDLLEIPEIPQKELTEIYRQGDGSSIIPLAHEIKNGQLPNDFMQNQKDRSYFACQVQQIEPLISKVALKAKQKGFTPQDIQVLAPMYKGPAGINALNKMMQEIFNSNADGTKKEVIFNDTAYRIGDKVLQLVNSPEDNVFNGDMGEITGIIYAKDSEDKVDQLVIAFDANEVIYKRNEWNKITLSYCCSIHKAQGSEFKMVILPMVNQFSRMLQRNLLYTAVTRSKEMLILLGETSAYERCVEQVSTLRLTALKERIAGIDSISPSMRLKILTYENEQEEAPFENDRVQRKSKTKSEQNSTSNKAAVSDLFAQETEDVAPTTSTQLTEELINAKEIDPMIGMGELKPYDFQTTEK